MRIRPKSIPDLVCSEMNGEGLVYDFRTHQAHCLNLTAYAVFRRLDGRTSIEELARAAGRELGAELSEHLVCVALRELDAAGLLTEPFVPPRAVDLYRRRALKQVALTAGASLAIPALWSILAPTTAEAASAVTCTGFTTCMMAGDCCGTPGGDAMTCNNNNPPACGNNGNTSICMNMTCA